MGAEPIGHVAVFSKPHPEGAAILRRIAACIRGHGRALLPDQTSARALGLPDWLPREEAGRRAELVVTVGGDGTLLATARAIGERGTPILGINMGNLGFLTETRCEEVDEVLTAALEGRAPLEERPVLEVSRNGDPPGENDIVLNDVVVSQHNLARLFRVSLFVDGEWVADYRADGLIIAGPTGSTAYSLSAGGPVLDPRVEAMLVTPICPHSLSQRPIVLPGSACITASLPEGHGAGDVWVTLDGQTGFPLAVGESITVRRARHRVRLVRPLRRSFFSLLRDKLGWGHP